MAKPMQAWGVTFAHDQSRVMPWTVRRTRTKAIKAAYGMFPIGWSDIVERKRWAVMRKRGYKAVKVSITIIED